MNTRGAVGSCGRSGKMTHQPLPPLSLLLSTYYMPISNTGQARRGATGGDLVDPLEVPCQTCLEVVRKSGQGLLRQFAALCQFEIQH